MKKVIIVILYLFVYVGLSLQNSINTQLSANMETHIFRVDFDDEEYPDIVVNRY
jgi:uncharacterized membrane protein YdcZ (DUF606 family)